MVLQKKSQKMQFKVVWMEIWQHWTEIGDKSFKN